ncbi:MAG: 50S ribosomal protein L23 [Bacteroidetes bacterium HGW-Bacteroidetes-6]|jgi:large subunit ribosomal protein L23|nr:MAG: 50S ribosomal protein L23 [Bacteroidetes bacterium HGW-Bacteroidetes-6]
MDVLIRPLVTEKMTAKNEQLNQFGFIVYKTANKIQIKEAVESLYGVHVVEVNTMIYAGKRKFRGTRRGWVSGRTNAFKKAIITLKAGEKIDFYSNV